MGSGIPLGPNVGTLSLLSISTPVVLRTRGGSRGLAEIKVPSALGGSATHRQVQWMKLEHIPGALQVIYQSINLLPH